VAESFLRLFRILQLVPPAPRSIDTVTLEAILVREGFHGARRTLQRDLVRLERLGVGLECLSTSKPYRWRFLETARLPAPLRASWSPPPRGGAMLLVLLVDRHAHELLLAHPLAPGQAVMRADDGAWLLEASVPDTPALRAQLLAMAGDIEVLEPLELRRAMAEAHEQGRARHEAPRARARRV
jgi:predicted DNA-binding transcriptional regulator YafY